MPQATVGTVDDKTEYAPILAPSSGLHWAKRKARDHHPLLANVTYLHIANAAGRLLCDRGPSVSRGVEEPVLASQIHGTCLHVYRKDHAK